jgi:hypothetical protein
MAVLVPSRLGATIVGATTQRTLIIAAVLVRPAKKIMT